MSASNWAACPQCKNRMVTAKRDALAAVRASYGEVSPGEYEKALRKTEYMTETPPQNTFREDYEIYGAMTGRITVSYRGGCTVCGLSLSFTEEHPFYPSGHQRSPEPSAATQAYGATGCT